jgi:hypothetical protein
LLHLSYKEVAMSMPSDPQLNLVELIPVNPNDPGTAAMARRGITCCRAGQPVARRVTAPLDAPRDPNHPLVSELRTGPFVAWDDAAGAYLARKSGHVWLLHNRLEVEDTLELPDDIDSATGPVTYEGHLVIHKNVLDSASVKAAGNITVNGAIEAAEVQSGGDMIVHHGICGKDRGVVSAKGHLSARFITNARVSTGGDIVIANEVINSNILCGGLLKVEHGTLLAGHAIAQTGILCHTAGSDVGQATILEIGLAPDRYEAMRKAIAAAETSRQKAREIRNAVEPLLARAKTLTPAQKEKATELLYSADETEAGANQAIAAFESSRTILRNAIAGQIKVSSLLHPGVQIRFPIAEGVTASRFRGPVEVALDSHGSESRVVVIDRTRNSSTPLNAPLGAVERTTPARQLLLQGSQSAPNAAQS